MARQRTKHTGVYQRAHATRRHLGRPDICYDITYKDASGKKRWEKVGWVSQQYTAAMAAEVRSERIRSMRHGDMPSISRRKGLTFAQGFEEYKKRHLYQVKTAEEDIRRYTAYLSPTLAAKPLASITALDIEDIKRRMSATYSPQTVKHALGLVRRVYRKLSDWGLYQGKLPTDTVAMPKVDAARTRFLTPEEAELLLAALKRRSRKWHDIALLSLKTGMRLGEILSLRAEDVNLEAKTIYLRDAKAGSRAVILSEAACTVLAGRMRPRGLIFPSRGSDGQGVSCRVSNSYLLAVKDTGLNDGITDARQKVVFHTLRHTFASWLAQNGVPLYVIGELLGHKTLEMTKRYSHLCPDAKHAAVGAIDGLMG